ncbi:histidine kinase N-terminal 7TM domain-containing protein [Cellulomonas sp. NS3]|uniref:histidine kinase N-terminal 7TM domain-containing protein n=1 Tax=Cellulomonas sp. NS3 TaxID=2973977 RepID=UPI002162019D|nr:histidine kinase N-terminal 7TM domain-containing protein [Cellulomonas sp. NS3]
MGPLVASVYVASAILCTTVAVYAWRNRVGRAVTATSLAAVAVGAGWWSVVAALQAGGAGDAVSAVASLAVYPGIGLLVLAFTVLARSVATGDWSPSRRLLALLAVEPVLVTAVAATNPWHRLLYHGPGTGELATPQLWEHGPAFWVHTAYSYGLLLVGMVTLAVGWWKAPQVFRRQYLSVLLASLVPVAVNVLSVFDALPGLTQPTPLGFAATGAIMAWAIFRQDLIAFAPVARALVVDRIGEYVIVVSPDGRILDVNPAADRFVRSMNPGGPATLLGSSASSALGGFDVSDLLAGSGDVDRVVHGHDRTVELQLSSSRLVDNRGVDLGVVLVGRDVTEANEQRRELAAANERLGEQLRTIEVLRADLAEQASRDPLTGLLNRRRLMVGLAEAMAASHGPAASVGPGGSVAVLMVDVDHFKQVNDRWGHRAGDEVLVQLARLLCEVTPEDALVGRWGGEEFLVVLPGADTAAAASVAETVRARCAEPPACASADGAPRARTVSIGVAATRSPTGAPDMLVDAADSALYDAKHGGRDCVRVHPGLAADERRAASART